MEKGEIATMNSYALDTSIEEFNKEQLEEAGVVIDYDQISSMKKIKVERANRSPKKNNKYLRWIFLGFLFLALFIIMYIGNQLIDSRQMKLDDQKAIVILNKSIDRFRLTDYWS